MTICTYNARTLASEAAIEDLMVQAKKIKYDEHATVEVLVELASSSTQYGTEHRLFRTTRPNRTSADERCGPTSALTIFVAYAQHQATKKKSKLSIWTWRSSTRRSCLYKVIIGDFNAKVGPRRTPEELHIRTHGLQWNDQGAFRVHHDD
ncbi:hypothetical protein RB195_019580 [Necator americanus]|uniref:Endonuclease/exonuclease/phosphatase domain-containing protein n=1 Tax=Necator americanus TaxID=51031 RepID=A0ABR1CH32_NECAM